MLRYSVVFAVQNLEIDVIPAIIFKSVTDNFPSVTSVVIDEALYIFKNENLWFTFFYDSCKLTKKRSSSIFKPFSFSHHRESLTWRSADKNIYFPLEWRGVKGLNIRMPTAFINVVVGKIRFLAFIINISSKYNLSVKT